jgi:lipopolysaccharide export system protein LptA
MVRNVILFVSTTAVLVLLFVGYVTFVGSPAPDGPAGRSETVELSQATEVPEEKRVHIETQDGPLDIDPGGAVYYIDYDDLGRPIAYYSWQKWEKVPGTANKVAAAAPKMIRRLPTGMIMTISAERGEFSVDQLGGTDLRPKLGWLAGDARIVVDRETSYDRTPLDERPDDRITIEMERLDFDLELGEIKTADPLRVTSPEFEITGTGLHLIWNQDDNRIEKLLIEQGGQMVFEGALLAGLDRPSRRSEPGEEPAVTQPAPPVTPTPRRKSRTPTAYRCLFADNVLVEHFADDQRSGALSADELRLLVDILGRSGGLSRRDDAPTNAPSTQPDAAPKRRVVVRWTGQLLIRPDSDPPSADEPRRRVEARGEPVSVELPNGRVVCGRLALHEETERLWLYPTADGYVEVTTGQELAVRATSVFADLEAETVKLVGDVLFSSGTGRSEDNDSLTISANLWAELRLGAEGERGTAEGVFENPLASRPPESAVFVGDVAVSYRDQLLRSNRLEADFSPADNTAEVGDGAGGALRAMLDSAVATGDVHLTVAERDARQDWRQVLERGVQTMRRAAARARSESVDEGFLPPISGENRSLTCASLRLNFVTTGGKIHIGDVEAAGAVEIYDRDSRFAARGRRLNATFAGNADREELRRATVIGTELNPALVQARHYKLRGEQIEADNLARTLQIDGPSTLRFDSRRSLQGFTAGRSDETITVTSTKSLHVDEPGNTVQFVGEVVAGTENEQLRADTLTLLLEDASDEAAPAMSTKTPAAVRGLLGNLLGKPKSSRSSRSLFGSTGSNGDTRKELARLVAQNAVIQSERYTPDRSRLLEHQSVSAPELQIDVRQRMIRAVGETVLGMTDYRLSPETESAGASVDFSSSLMSRGPSQTAMVAHQGLVYMLGEEGAGRQDSALLEGGVALRRVAGGEIVDLERMLPDVAKDPELLKNLDSRNSRLDCDRLEVLFAAGDNTLGPAPLGSGRGSLRLSWFNAFGNVYFRDQQNDSIREVYAHQLEYDRANVIMRVLGLPEEGIDARVYDQNRKTARLNMPISGSEIIINLQTGTIDAKDVRGRTGG